LILIQIYSNELQTRGSVNNEPIKDSIAEGKIEKRRLHLPEIT